jgi:hypothetical protein
VQDERWRLVITWRDGKRAGQEHASFPLIGLDERTVCRLFGFKGSHVPSLPVPVHGDHVATLQPYAGRPITMPNGTKGELFLDSDATSSRDMGPLLMVAVVAAAVAVGLWLWGGSTSGALAVVLHVAAVLAALLAVWSMISAFLVMMVVRAQTREQLAAEAAAARRRR